jgi:hypothetical protein
LLSGYTPGKHQAILNASLPYGCLCVVRIQSAWQISKLPPASFRHLIVEKHCCQMYRYQFGLVDVHCGARTDPERGFPERQGMTTLTTILLPVVGQFGIVEGGGPIYSTGSPR